MIDIILKPSKSQIFCIHFKYHFCLLMNNVQIQAHVLLYNYSIVLVQCVSAIRACTGTTLNAVNRSMQ